MKEPLSRSGETLTEQDIRRFRERDILLTDAQAEAMADLALQALARSERADIVDAAIGRLVRERLKGGPQHIVDTCAVSEFDVKRIEEQMRSNRQGEAK